MMDAATTISRCPYCRSDALALVVDREQNRQWVRCSQCSAQGPVRRYAVDAILHWNEVAGRGSGRGISG